MDYVDMFDDVERWVKQVNEESRDDGLDLWESARAVAAVMPREDLEKVAMMWLNSTVRARRRNQTRQIEQASVQTPRRRPTAAERAEREQERVDAMWAYMGKVKKIMDDYAHELKTEWTQELLDAGFALPDGTVVKWGDATVAEHQQRVDMFSKQAIAAVEDGARHQQAIDVLTESGASCLNDYVQNRKE